MSVLTTLNTWIRVVVNEDYTSQWFMTRCNLPLCLFPPFKIWLIFIFQNIKILSSIVLEMNSPQKSILCFLLLSGLFVFLPEIGRKKKEWGMKDEKIERMKRNPLNKIRWRANKTTQWGKELACPASWLELNSQDSQDGRRELTPATHVPRHACSPCLPHIHTYTQNKIQCNTNVKQRVRERVQRLRVHTALAEDLSFVPTSTSISGGWLKPAVTPAPGDSVPLASQGRLHSHARTHIQMQN